VDDVNGSAVDALAFPMVQSGYDVSLPPAVWDDLRAAAQWKLDEIREGIEASGVQHVTAQVSDSVSAVDAIADAVKSYRAELVVMGTHGRGGLRHAFLGSVAERAIRTIDQPILAVKEDRETAAKPISKILLAVDFSPYSDRAVAAAAGLAARLSATVDVIHAFDLPADFNPFLTTIGTELERKIEINVSEQLGLVRRELDPREGAFSTRAPEVVIADTARHMGCQLIVMGTRGQSGLSHVLLGSVAERTLRAAPCSVLCLKG
jgi:nucleotide-binding universal stress UspA family protein